MADASHAASKQESSCSTPLSSEINSLSDYQLKRLTRSNTKRNVGGKKKRFLSQLERVCRRLELLNVSPPVDSDTLTHSLHAIPVVNPDGSTFASQSRNKQQVAQTNQHALRPERAPQEHVCDDVRMPKRAQTPRFTKDTPFASGSETHNSEASVSAASSTEDDEFDIEPATVGCTEHVVPCSALTKSLRSVRISTEVTILGYSARSKEGEPVSLSVSTMCRTQHPTRNSQCFHLRARRANDNRFPRAMSALERAKGSKEIEGVARDGGNGAHHLDGSSGGRSKLAVLRHARGSPRAAAPHAGDGGGAAAERK